MGEVPRGVTEVLGRRFTITEAGAAAIGRRPTGTVRVPLLAVPWRERDIVGEPPWPVCPVCGERGVAPGRATCSALVCVLAPSSDAG